MTIDRRSITEAVHGARAARLGDDGRLAHHVHIILILPTNDGVAVVAVSGSLDRSQAGRIVLCARDATCERGSRCDLQRVL
jgi:hypothetical protein